MSIYHTERLIKYFDGLLQRNVSTATWEWLNEKVDKFTGEKGSAAFFIAFTAVPRYTGKAILSLSKEEQTQLDQINQGFSVSNYTIDRLARVWLLLHWPSEDKTTYLKIISQLFKAAEMNELVALYGALPLLSYPEAWTMQCAEGIRSYIGTVLEAIMCDNPYPSEYFDQPAWNQLVLKAFFTEKPVHRIIGLDKRANQTLAYTLSDYAHERWAAHRPVDPQLWRLVGKFIDERTYPDIKKVFKEGNSREKEAAALACAQSEFALARALLDEAPELKLAIENKKLNWENVATL